MPIKILPYLKRRARIYGGQVFPTAAVGAVSGGMAGLSLADSPDSSFYKSPGKAFLAGALGGAAAGGGIGGLHGVAQRQLRKARVYEYRSNNWGRRPKSYSGFGGKTTGAKNRAARQERWKPFTGYGFGKKPPPTAASLGMHDIFDKVPENLRRKAQGVASRARAGSTEAERSTSRSILEKMIKKHGIKVNIDDMIKNASFEAGLRSGIKRN